MMPGSGHEAGGVSGPLTPSEGVHPAKPVTYVLTSIKTNKVSGRMDMGYDRGSTKEYNGPSG